MSSYIGNTVAALNVNTPVGPVDPVADADDAIRQIKRVLTNGGTGGLLGMVYPIGCIWTSTTDNDPASTLGFGTWLKLEEVVLGAHKVGSTEFGTVTANKVGADVGLKYHTLTAAELPAHSHVYWPNDYDAYLSRYNVVDAASTNKPGDNSHNQNMATATTEETGGGDAHSSLQPTRVVYMWERTA